MTDGPNFQNRLQARSPIRWVVAWLVVASFGLEAQEPSVDKVTAWVCVQDESGQALVAEVGAHRIVLNSDGYRRFHQGFVPARPTDPYGCIDLPLAPGQHSVEASAPGFFSSSEMLRVPETTELTLSLEAFVTRPQGIRVVDRDTGEPVPDVRVAVEYLGKRRGPPESDSRTDGQGEVYVEALADGLHSIGVAGKLRTEYHQEEVELGPSRHLLTVEVAVNPRVLVVGVVVDENGQPLADVRVRAARFKSKTWTDAAGNFEVYAIVTPRSFVTVQAPGFKPKTVPIVVHERGERSAEDWDVVSVGEIVLERHP